MSIGIEIKDELDADETIDKLTEAYTETQVTVRGKNFEVAREVIPFDKLMEMSVMLAKSTIVPVMYQNRPENVFIALDMSSRMGIAPMLLMNNLYIIQGKPSLAGQFISALVRSTPMFRDVTLHYVGNPKLDDWGAYVTAVRDTTGQVIKGATVTIATAKKEGWYTKAGSKWQTMPELMLGYRAYTWFARQHSPELLNGLQSSDEIEDIERDKIVVVNPYEAKGDK